MLTSRLVWILRGLNTLGRFSSTITREKTIVLSVCIPAHQVPSEKVFILTGKNLLPQGANSFLLEWTPLQKGRQKNSDRAESVSIPVNCLHKECYSTVVHSLPSQVLAVTQDLEFGQECMLK